MSSQLEYTRRALVTLQSHLSEERNSRKCCAGAQAIMRQVDWERMRESPNLLRPYARHFALLDCIHVVLDGISQYLVEPTQFTEVVTSLTQSDLDDIALLNSFLDSFCLLEQGILYLPRFMCALLYPVEPLLKKKLKDLWDLLSRPWRSKVLSTIIDAPASLPTDGAISSGSEAVINEVTAPAALCTWLNMFNRLEKFQDGFWCDLLSDSSGSLTEILLAKLVDDISISSDQPKSDQQYFHMHYYFSRYAELPWRDFVELLQMRADAGMLQEGEKRARTYIGKLAEHSERFHLCPLTRKRYDMLADCPLEFTPIYRPSTRFYCDTATLKDNLSRVWQPAELMGLTAEARSVLDIPQNGPAAEDAQAREMMLRGTRHWRSQPWYGDTVSGARQEELSLVERRARELLWWETCARHIVRNYFEKLQAKFGRNGKDREVDPAAVAGDTEFGTVSGFARIVRCAFLYWRDLQEAPDKNIFTDAFVTESNSAVARLSDVIPSLRYTSTDHAASRPFWMRVAHAVVHRSDLLRCQRFSLMLPHDVSQAGPSLRQCCETYLLGRSLGEYALRPSRLTSDPEKEFIVLSVVVPARRSSFEMSRNQQAVMPPQKIVEHILIMFVPNAGWFFDTAASYDNVFRTVKIEEPGDGPYPTLLQALEECIRWCSSHFRYDIRLIPSFAGNHLSPN